LIGDFIVCKFACFNPSEEQEAELEKVAGFLEVSLIDNGQKIVIKVPGLKPDASGAARIVLSPRYARHLANLLIEHAMTAEAQLDDSLCRARQSPHLRGDGKSSG
jgi:hypothetical protein